jgi:hypothetical protein
MSGYSPLFSELKRWRRARQAQKADEGVLIGVLRMLNAAAKANPGVPQTEKFAGGSISVTYGDPNPPTVKPITYVVAYNYRQAADWARLNDLRLSQWHYVSRPELLRGLTRPQIMWLGWPQAWTPEQIEEYQINVRLAQR